MDADLEGLLCCPFSLLCSPSPLPPQLDVAPELWCDRRHRVHLNFENYQVPALRIKSRNPHPVYKLMPFLWPKAFEPRNLKVCRSRFFEFINCQLEVNCIFFLSSWYAGQLKVSECLLEIQIQSFRIHFKSRFVVSISNSKVKISETLWSKILEFLGGGSHDFIQDLGVLPLFS